MVYTRLGEQFPQAISIASNRRNAILSVTYYTLCFLLILLPLIGLCYVLITVNHLFWTSSGWVTLLPILTCCWSLYLFGRFIVHQVRQWLLGQGPAFVINEQGIMIGKVPGLVGGGLIACEKIECISLEKNIFRAYLSISLRPYQDGSFPFSKWTPFFQWNKGYVGKEIVILQSWVTPPLQTILQQIWGQYRPIFERYHITLHM